MNLNERRAADAPPCGFLGHPRSLAFLAGAEAWISFSYYGMQSLLVLYMASRLLKPGHIEQVLGFGPFCTALRGLYGPLSGQPLASAICGLYAALAFATPILGGYAADRWFGRTPTVVAGCVLLTIGYFLLAFEPSFLIALACLVVGAGCAGTLKAQVGGLYAKGDPRRCDAFQLTNLVVSVAVIFAPLACGTLGEKVAWRWGFGAAGVGTLIALMFYARGVKSMPPEPARKPQGRAIESALTGKDWRVLAILIGLMPVIAVATLGNMEIFNGYLLWGKANYQLGLFGRTMPVSWLLSLNALVGAIAIAGSMAFWRWWGRRRRQPDEIVKVALGATVMALAPLILATASLQAAHGRKVGLLWGLSFHFVNAIGFANLYAMGVALYSRAAPKSLAATVVNLFALSIFLANLMVGRLAGLLSDMSGATFWLMHAGLVLVAAIALLIAARVFRRQLAPSSVTASTLVSLGERSRSADYGSRTVGGIGSESGRLAA
jgi:POT family proton-dependent oligopeptide transporter